MSQSSLCIKIDSSFIESKEKSPKFKGGKWNKEEHQKFIEGLFIFGNQWKKMQKYIETRSAIQVRSHSQKFMMKLKKKYIELFGKEELIEGDFESQSKHIEYLLTNFFDCEFITTFLKKVNEAKETDNKVIEYINEKKFQFIKIIIALMNNSTVELFSRKIKYQQNLLSNSPITTMSSSNESSQSSPNPNDQFYIDYCARNDYKDIKDDLFKISFNDFIQSQNDNVDNEEEFLFFNDM